jgi:hypothetical protein
MTPTLKLIGLAITSCGLLTCGQPNASTSFANTIQTTSVAAQKPSSAVLSQSQQAQIASTASKSSNQLRGKPSKYRAEPIYKEFERLTQKACTKQEKVVGNLRYSLCSVIDSRGINRIVSAASSLANAGDGAGYWLNEQGEIYAIRYFHSGEVVVLLDDKKTIAELIQPRTIKLISDQARWNGLELGARDQLMTISEQFDSQPNPPTSSQVERRTVEQVALQQLNRKATIKAAIKKSAIANNTALLSWQQGEAGGMILLKKQGDGWSVLESGGGAMSLMNLSENDVPRATAEALLTQIDPNWRKYTASDASPKTAVPITRINVARAGGDQFHHWVTLVVPDKNTAVAAYGGELRRYDVHLAKMIELTAHDFCGSPSRRGAYFNYEADNGRVFMGKFFISCSTARSTVETYGLGKPERTIVQYAGNPETLNVPVLDLRGNKIRQFQQTIVKRLTPECIETGGKKLCPGDRI